MTRPTRIAAIGAIVASLCTLGPTLRAQTTYDSPRGMVEVIGLHRWTLAMLRDSLSSRRPGLTLEDAACMRVLREELGFPDASVDDLSFQESATSPERHFVVMKLVEPGDSARSSWRRVKTPAGWRVPPAYDSALAAIGDSAGTLLPALVIPLVQQVARGRTADSPAAAQTRETAAVRTLLAREAGRGGRARAASILRQGTLSQRMLAAMVLSQFPQHDKTWEELIMALRDPAPNVREVAHVALGAMPARAIRWTPRVVPSLRALLGGTNVGATELVFGILAATKVPPSLAPTLLRDNGEWILMQLAAANPVTRGATRNFLVQMNGGVDVGTSAAWARWLARA